MIAGPEKRFKFPVTKNPMNTYKPDLNEKITIRLSIDAKNAIKDLCAEVDFDESWVARTALEAGIQIAREKGIVSMIAKRQQGVPSRKTTAPKKAPAPKKSKADFILVKNPSSKSWRLLNKAREVIATGPLYDLRPRAKALCSHGSSAEIHHPDGTIEKLV